MPIDESVTDKVTELKPTIFTPGLFVKLRMVDDKDTMKWILIKFLKETLDYLGDPDNRDRIKKINRGKLIEEWIDANLPSLFGEYDRQK